MGDRCRGGRQASRVTHHHVSQLTADGHLVGRQLPQHDAEAENVHLHTHHMSHRQDGEATDTCK